MDIPKDILEKVFLGIKTFLAEYEMMNEVQRLCTEKVPTYAESLHNICDSVEKLQSVKNRGLLEHRSISFSILNILALELSNLNSAMKKVEKWNNTRMKKGCCKWLKKFTDSPSKINQLLVENLEKIMPNLYLVEELESSIFGSAIKIENDILRDAWMLMGANQLNDSSIDKNILIDNLFLLLKKEIGIIKQPDFWKNKIEIFVELLDGNISSSDGKISIAELNEIPEKYKKTEKLSEILLDVEPIYEMPKMRVSSNTNEIKSRQVNEIKLVEKKEKQLMPLIIDYKPTSINANLKNGVPKCEGYGSAKDWRGEIVGHFIIPENQNKQLLNIEMKIQATDQGWGGSGHCQIRYQINESMPIIGFTINRKTNEKDEYNFAITGDKVKCGNVVKIWAFCPPWNGWETHVTKIEGCAIFL